MKFIAIFLFFPFFLNAEAFSSSQREEVIKAIYRSAERDEPSCQCFIGTLYELGEEVPQNSEEAVRWYLAAAKQGSSIAQKRLGLLYFFGNGVSQDKVKGFAMILISSMASPTSNKKCESVRKLMLHYLTQDEIEKAFDLATQWTYDNFSKPSSQKSIVLVKEELRTRGDDGILLVSDRWDPADANERIYGPGTHDGNTGILKSDFLEMQRQIEHFVGQLNNLKDQSTPIKSESLQEKIETLKREAESLKVDAFFDACLSVLEAMVAGLSFEVPPAAILAGLASINSIKESAEKYCKSIDVQKEIGRLMEMERSLERSKELERANDRRG